LYFQQSVLHIFTGYRAYLHQTQATVILLGATDKFKAAFNMT